jgi:beta-glucanase (GH16 family)
MVITFDEEFNSFSRYLDVNGNVTCNSGGTGRWQTVYQFCSRTSPANLEAEIYIDQNFIDYLNSQTTLKTAAVSPFSLNNGILTIESNPSDQAILTAAGSWAKYTSGLLTTEYSFSQLYGYFEIRAKLPVGQGLWPAFWLLPTDKVWPPEIDIMEILGDKPNQVLMTYHFGETDNPQKEDTVYTAEDFTKGWHTYSVKWEPGKIDWFIDGVLRKTSVGSNIPSEPMQVILNLAVGGNLPGSPDDNTVFPSEMLVDYVRVKQPSE